MAVDKAQLRKLISEILDAADLNTITAKKVRQQLEEKLDTDLSERRKEVDAIVMEVLNEKQETKSDEDEEESEPEEKPKKNKRKSKKASDSEDEDDDYKPAGKKAKGKKSKKDSDDDSDGDWKKKKAAPKRGKKEGGAKKGGGGGTGYTKTCTLSPELAAVMGEPNMARHEVVKRMWKLIKEKNLYDPKNKQFALCNEELLPVFGVKRFRTFGMMKHLKRHFTD